jgi:hypothetical protein
MKPTSLRILAAALAALPACAAFATNPLITDQYTADPTARVFEGRVYVYPSHDIAEPPGYKGRPKWFVMEDYHVFSSANLTDWQDHGVILTRSDVEWADQNAYAMWAPDAVFKDGRYYFYFPAVAKSGGFRIGVAIADKPYGPFKPLAAPIEGVRGIDPGVLIDQDGSAYLYWSATDKLFAAKLKPNMVEIDGEPRTFDNLPKKGLQEGPFVFERNGTYYLTYPHVANKIERLEYATSDSPLGPFTWAGVILDESASGCWTVHHSIVDYQGQWYLFYLDPRGQAVLRCRRRDPQGHADAARRRAREVHERNPDRSAQRGEPRGHRDFIPRRRQPARRVEDCVHRRRLLGAFQRGRFRPRRSPGARSTRQGRGGQRARDSRGWTAGPAARQGEGRPERRLEHLARGWKESVRGRSRSLHHAHGSRAGRGGLDPLPLIADAPVFRGVVRLACSCAADPRRGAFRPAATS